MTNIESVQRDARDLALEVVTDSDFKKIPLVLIWLQTRDRFELEVLTAHALRVIADLAALPKVEIEA